MGKKTGSVNHVHQYFKRHDGLWACSGIDGCTHYMPKNMYPAPTGQKSVCWSCNTHFQLTPANMESNDKPTCDKCAEELDVFGSWITDKENAAKEKNPLASFKSANPLKSIMKIAEPVEPPDEIEVIEADEVHAPDCEVYVTGECTCR